MDEKERNGCGTLKKNKKIVMLERKSVGDDVDVSALEQLGELVVYDYSDAENTPERIRDADVVIVNKVPMNEQTLGEAGKLRFIAATATGTNIFDMDYCRRRGIQVANVTDYSTYSVAQHTFAMLFYVLEKLPYYDDYVKSGGYCGSPLFTHLDQRFWQIRGKVWGIIGLGNIGREVARIAGAFGCKVIYYSTSGKNSNGEYKRVELDELLRQSDIISIHAPLNAATENLMDREKFQKMKKSAILLNLGRGPIINEADLADALEAGELAGAGLDVLCREPMDPDCPLRRLAGDGRLLITPHIAWASVEARQLVVDETAKNIQAWQEGIARNLV